VHDLTSSAELLDGEGEVVYADADCQGIAKGPEIAVKATEFRVVMQPDKPRVLPDAPAGRLRGLIKNRCKVNVVAALVNRFVARRLLVSAT
jgi:IS5 family transposase